MHCRYCPAETVVLSTRKQSEFFLVRRRACTGPEEHRFNTVEVLQQYINKLGGRARRDKVLAYFERGAAQRRLTLWRKAEVGRLSALGVKQVAIAAELGVSLDCVRVNVRKLRNGQPGKIGRPRKKQDDSTET